MALNLPKIFTKQKLRNLFQLAEQDIGTITDLPNGSQLLCLFNQDDTCMHLYDPAAQTRTCLQSIKAQNMETMSFSISQLKGHIACLKRGPYHDENVQTLHFITTNRQGDLKSIDIKSHSEKSWEMTRWSSRTPEDTGDFTAVPNGAIFEKVSAFYESSFTGMLHGIMPDFGALQDIVTFPLVGKSELNARNVAVKPEFIRP